MFNKSTIRSIANAFTSMDIARGKRAKSEHLPSQTQLGQVLLGCWTPTSPQRVPEFLNPSQPAAFPSRLEHNPLLVYLVVSAQIHLQPSLHHAQGTCSTCKPLPAYAAHPLSRLVHPRS